MRVMTMASKLPKPLFDNIEALEKHCDSPQLTPAQNRNYHQSCEFLLCYKNNSMTFTAYRREVERLLQWCFLRQEKVLQDLKREDMDAYLKFCQAPLKSWISLQKVPRFITIHGKRLPNPKWRPFVVTLSKNEAFQGKQPDKTDYQLSEKSLRDIMTATSSFFNFLIQEDILPINPMQQLRQKSRYFTQYQSKKIIRKLSELQWGYVIETAHLMAADDDKHERCLFIISALYGMYLRISELIATPRWCPQMGHFQRDNDGLWWFTTVGKGNKQRQIAVSPAMLKALKRWRKHLGLSVLPSIGETMPLLPKQLGQGPLRSDRPIRQIVQQCFDNTVARLQADGFHDDAEQLMSATVHWLRHTGISDDVKIRPREHVRDDAGHSSSAMTDKYIDVTLQERSQSARKKQIIPADIKEDIRNIDQSEQ